MSDWPRNSAMPRTITSFNRRCMGPARVLNGVDPGTASAAWVGVNGTLYLPFTLEGPFPVTKACWVNGTVVSGNCALAVYLYDLATNQQTTQVFSTGSVAQAGTSQMQVVTLANPVLLLPGSYWFGFGCDNTTATFARSAVPNAIARAAGIAAEVAFPPPVHTAQASAAVSYWPLVGISNDPLF